MRSDATLMRAIGGPSLRAPDGAGSLTRQTSSGSVPVHVGDVLWGDEHVKLRCMVSLFGVR